MREITKWKQNEENGQDIAYDNDEVEMKIFRNIRDRKRLAVEKGTGTICNKQRSVECCDVSKIPKKV